jgi:hypothetical protein
MKFVSGEDDAIQYEFEIPDDLTVRQMLRYDQVFDLAPDDQSVYERCWYALPAIVQDWKCDVELGVNVEKLTKPDEWALIKRVGLIGFSVIQSKKAMPKNS